MTSALTRVSVVRSGGPDEPLLGYLARAGWMVTEGLDGDVVLVLGATDLPHDLEDRLLALDVPVLVVGPTMSTALSDAAGVVPGRLTPLHETRVRPGPDAVDVGRRLGGDLLVTEAWPLQEKVADEVEVLLTANVAFTDHPVATWRPASGLGLLTVGSTQQTYADASWQRIVHRLLRRITGQSEGAPVRVGILGYGAIGHEHSTAISLTEGLELVAVCDPNPLRVAAAQELAPGVRGVDDLLAQDDVDLVIVSTPPATHAEWALRCLEAGKSVVVEKPFCITVAEADRQIAAAAERGLTLAVYQNRRWDPDYLALKKVVRSGALGEVFHYESFIGGYGHPCNYWHSDEAISGGAIYDWGSHYLDWVLDLFDQEVEWVSAT
ncbi:MAG: Gfo/Idh/MocA family oxidoreductase, partial [Actinobacteria bacterium]|nr:Gfo/Idh/MocA family oxidoreductase [Actinomycetota bacterium]